MHQQPYQHAENRITRFFACPITSIFVGWATLFCPRGTYQRCKLFTVRLYASVFSVGYALRTVLKPIWLCNPNEVQPKGCKRGAYPTIFALIALVLSGNVYAGDTTRHYQIPAQSLNNALMRFAADSNLELVFSADKVRGLSAVSLDGTMTAAQALTRLLQGSGMTYRFINAHSVTLEQQPGNFRKTAATPEEPQTHNSDEGESQMMPKVTVEEDADNPYSDPNWATDPTNPDYHRPKAGSANRVETPIMQTPMSILVVPGAVLKDQQAVQVGDAIKNVSGTFQGFTQGGFAEDFIIRGFRTNFNNYLDGFRWPASRLTLANAERVEVVKGAAANLYGRIEPGGMINVVTKRPQATPYQAIQQQFGSYDMYRTTVDSTGALNNDGSLLYRANLEYLSDNTFRDFGATERIFLAPSLTWHLSDRTKLDLDFMYTNTDALQDYGVVAGRLTKRPIQIPKNVFLGEPSTDTTSTLLYSTFITLTHQFDDDWKLRTRFSHLNRDTHDVQTYGYDFNDNPADHINDDNGVYGDLFRDYYGAQADSDTFYGTFELSGKFKAWDVEHQVLFGWEGYLSDSTLVTQWDPINFAVSTLNIFRPVYKPTDISTLSTFYQDGSGSNSNGLFFQDQIVLFDKLHILGGGRYDWIEDSGSGFAEASAEEAYKNRTSNSYDQFSPRVGLLYQPWPWLSAFANYSESIGSNNANRGRSGAMLAPETGQQYEIGFKTSLFNDQLTTNFAYYQLTKQNVAVSQPDGFALLFPGVKSEGFELDISGEITEGLRLITSYAYTDAIILKGQDFSGNKFDGNRLFNVPRNAGSVWATYDLPFETLRGLTVGAGTYLQSQKQGDSANSFQLPGWVRLDMMLKYSIPVNQATATLQFNIENLLDHTYYSASGSDFYANVGQPRTFIGSVKVEF